MKNLEWKERVSALVSETYSVGIWFGSLPYGLTLNTIHLTFILFNCVKLYNTEQKSDPKNHLISLLYFELTSKGKKKKSLS